MSVATKANPSLWEAAKRAACSEARLCDHSARKMQWATRYYKSKGGRYVGARRADNRLSEWTRQKWRTRSGRRSDGKRRYLPSAAWDALTPSQARRTDAAKAEGTKRGKQYVRQPADVVRATRPFRAPGSKRV